MDYIHMNNYLRRLPYIRKSSKTTKGKGGIRNKLTSMAEQQQNAPMQVVNGTESSRRWSLEKSTSGEGEEEEFAEEEEAFVKEEEKGVTGALFLFKISPGVFLTIQVKCWMHQQ